MEVVKGLRPGERIVMSGNFLIGSESQLKGISTGSNSLAHNVNDTTSTAHDSAGDSTVIDPACGMEVDPAQARAAGYVSHYQNKSSPAETLLLFSILAGSASNCRLQESEHE